MVASLGWAGCLGCTDRLVFGEQQPASHDHRRVHERALERSLHHLPELTPSGHDHVHVDARLHQGIATALLLPLFSNEQQVDVGFLPDHVIGETPQQDGGNDPVISPDLLDQ